MVFQGKGEVTGGKEYSKVQSKGGGESHHRTVEEQSWRTTQIPTGFHQDGICCQTVWRLKKRLVCDPRTLDQTLSEVPCLASQSEQHQTCVKEN